MPGRPGLASGLHPRAPLVDALLACLRDGSDPEADPPRTSHELGAGQLLLMPSGTGDWVGTKLVTVAPGNPERGLPLVQGSYVLFDAATLSALTGMLERYSEGMHSNEPVHTWPGV